uniref:Zona pellucida sperm-binding protein 1/4 Ig-like domain-containing protein n=1 Tax=Salarias fasciatus TaxID=181472 RepID=A0A672G406_SALFA
MAGALYNYMLKIDELAALGETCLHLPFIQRSIKLKDERGTACLVVLLELINCFLLVSHSVMDKKLKRLDPSVQCNNDTMSLKVKRVSAMHFLVDNGEKPLTPLAQMPSKCGFTMKRSRRDVQFAASYQGCHVTHQGGEYILPLRLWGTPMTMTCPAMLPSPSVFCFPSGMVVKFVGITASDLTVRGKWFDTLTNVAAVVHFGDEYVLSLLWTDVELFITCPSVPTVKPTTATVTLPSDTGQAPARSLDPPLPVFPENPVPTPALTSAPAPQTAAPTSTPFPLRQHLPVTAAKTDAKKQTSSPAPVASPYPQYSLFPRSEPPQLSPLRQLLPPSQYLFSVFPQYPMIPGNLHPVATSPPPATSTEVPLTSPAPTTEHGAKQQLPPDRQFPHRSVSFLKRPPSQDLSKNADVTKPMIPLPAQLQHVYPQTFPLPVLYSPDKNLLRQPSTQSISPATPQAPVASQPFYHPYSYMHIYYVPQQAVIPVFPDLSATPPTNTAPSYEHKSVSQALPLHSVSSP